MEKANKMTRKRYRELIKEHSIANNRRKKSASKKRRGGKTRRGVDSSRMKQKKRCVGEKRKISATGNKASKKRMNRKHAALIKLFIGQLPSFKQIPLLNALGSMNDNKRKVLINSLNPSEFNAMRKLLAKFLDSDIPLRPEEIKKLRKYKNFIHNFVHGQEPLDQKKRQLLQNGGFLSAIIGPLLSSAVGGILGLLQK